MRLASAILLATLEAPVMAGTAAADDAEARLGEARRLVRRGLLAQAEVVLADVTESDAPEPQAHAQLLLGNVAYERARFEEAREHYLRAVELFDALATESADRSPARDVSRSNLELAAARLDRRRELRDRADVLHAALAGVLAGSLLLAAWLARRAGRPAPTG